MQVGRSSSALLISLAFGALSSAQVRPLHTRDATRLSEVQIAAQLEHSDVGFVPIGAVEANGIMPSDRDYVSALGFAMAMAEEVDALYVPGLVHSYPGTTVVGASTVYMSPSEGLQFSLTLARSLLRQGFRRQVWLSISHGPAALTAGTLARQFFEEERVPILYVDLDQKMAKMKIPAAERSLTIYGAHALAGRLEDIPLQGDYGADVLGRTAETPHNEGLAKLSELGYTGSLALGSWIADVLAHAGSLELAETDAQRRELGEQGTAQIRAVVSKMRLSEAMEALQEHDRFTQEVIVPKFEGRLPR